MDKALLGTCRLTIPFRQIEVELVECGGAGLAEAGAGQHAKAGNPGCALIGIGAEGVDEAQDSSEASNREFDICTCRLASENLKQSKRPLVIFVSIQ